MSIITSGTIVGSKSPREAQLMIAGIVEAGSGLASRIREDMFQERCRAAGASLVRGTLNVRVGDLAGSVSELATPDFETDKDHQKLGPLRWWRIELRGKTVPATEAKTFVVRHHGTQTDYLEVMSEVRFKDLGVKNGDEVVIDLLGSGARG